MQRLFEDSPLRFSLEKIVADKGKKEAYKKIRKVAQDLEDAAVNLPQAIVVSFERQYHEKSHVQADLAAWRVCID